MWREKILKILLTKIQLKHINYENKGPLMFDFRNFHSDFFSSEFSVASVSGIEPDIEMSLEFRRFMSFSTPSAYRTDWKENEDGIN